MAASSYSGNAACNAWSMPFNNLTIETQPR